LTAVVATTAHLQWNLWADVRQMLGYHFMINALRAGTATAVAAGLVGWFMVLRQQSFAGHTLALVGFPGAAGATWLGLSATWGYFGFCVAAALALAGVARRTGPAEADPATIGTVQVFALACGLLFVSLYRGFLSGLTALLFGSFLGVTDNQVLVLVVVAALCAAVLAAIGRPLIFASIDPDVAAARGVPVRLMSAVFMVLLGATAAEVSQITGSLLVFALLVTPAAAARQVTGRAVWGLVTSVAIGVAVTWIALTLAFFSSYPVGFYVTTGGFAAYLLASTGRLAAVRFRR
jgi:zinc/manganese transport system permease protein